MPGLPNRNSRHVRLNTEAPRDSNPGTSPKSCRGARLSQTQYFKGMPRNGRSLGKRTSLPAAKLDGCLTDPEPDIDSGRATISNMRSKCRCSCVLQFTFRHAVGCVLHRPPSQVIHCTVLFFNINIVVQKHQAFKKTVVFAKHPIAGVVNKQTRNFGCSGEDALSFREKHLSIPGHQRAGREPRRT